MSYPMKCPPMERKPDGSLYRMTPKQHREAVRLHRQNRAKYCANCKAIVQREQKAAYARRRRAESRKIEA